METVGKYRDSHPLNTGLKWFRGLSEPGGKTMKKRDLSEKQLAALAKGRKKRAKNIKKKQKSKDDDAKKS